MSEFVQNANDGNFAEAVLNTKKPVLVDFWAQWCGAVPFPGADRTMPSPINTPARCDS